MNAADKRIADEYPWIIAVTAPSCRWLPLRTALSTFDKLNADTLLMLEWGLLVRVKPDYVWYAWPAEQIITRRRAGLYDRPLLKDMLADLKAGRCIYKDRPDRSV